MTKLHLMLSNESGEVIDEWTLDPKEEFTDYGEFYALTKELFGDKNPTKILLKKVLQKVDDAAQKRDDDATDAALRR